MGQNTTASGVGSVAMGYSTTASGMHSTAMGRFNTSRSYGETVLGIGSTIYTHSANGDTQFSTANATDRLFVVGNAIDANNNGIVDAAERSDAFTILKNGNMKFGNAGTYQKNIQTGQAIAGSSVGSNFKTYTIVFPTPFTTNPRITVTAHNEGNNQDDVFVVSVRAANTTQCTVNIYRVNNESTPGWNQQLRINYVAWEQ